MTAESGAGGRYKRQPSPSRLLPVRVTPLATVAQSLVLSLLGPDAGSIIPSSVVYTCFFSLRH